MAKKFFKTRTEIAKALNYGKYPVVYKDVNDCFTEYGLDLGTIRIDLGDAHFKKHGWKFNNVNLYIYKDEKRLTTTSKGTFISNRFCFEDLVEDSEIATSPIIYPDKPFVLVLTDRKDKTGIAMEIMPIAESYSSFTTTPLRFEDDDMTDILNDLNVKIDKDEQRNAL